MTGSSPSVAHVIRSRATPSAERGNAPTVTWANAATLTAGRVGNRHGQRVRQNAEPPPMDSTPSDLSDGAPDTGAPVVRGYGSEGVPATALRVVCVRPNSQSVPARMGGGASHPSGSGERCNGNPPLGWGHVSEWTGDAPDSARTRAASIRLPTPSRRNIDLTWYFTVFSVMNSRVPISS